MCGKKGDFWLPVRHTVDPWVGHDDGTLRQLQLGNFGLDALIFHHSLLDGNDLLTITRSVNEGAKAGIALDLVSRQVDDSLMKFVLQAD